MYMYTYVIHVHVLNDDCLTFYSIIPPSGWLSIDDPYQTACALDLRPASLCILWHLTSA